MTTYQPIEPTGHALSLIQKKTSPSRPTHQILIAAALYEATQNERIKVTFHQCHQQVTIVVRHGKATRSEIRYASNRQYDQQATIRAVSNLAERIIRYEPLEDVTDHRITPSQILSLHPYAADGHAVLVAMLKANQIDAGEMVEAMAGHHRHYEGRQQDLAKRYNDLIEGGRQDVIAFNVSGNNYSAERVDLANGHYHRRNVSDCNINLEPSIFVPDALREAAVRRPAREIFEHPYFDHDLILVERMKMNGARKVNKIAITDPVVKLAEYPPAIAERVATARGRITATITMLDERRKDESKRQPKFL